MFKEALTILTIYGIPIKLHFSFLLILPFLAWTFGNNIQFMAQMANIPVGALNLHPYLLGFLVALALFGSVALHELAHSVVAMNKGVEIHSITLMLLGGVAEMEDLSPNPRDEALVALAGPALSIFLGILLLTSITLFSGFFFAFPDLQLVTAYLGQINIFLALFNLFPAFPTDGGRILRALIASRTSSLTATRIAAFFGRNFALLFGILGLLSGNIILMLIAFFIYIGATEEYRSSLFQTTLSGFTVSQLMTTDISTVEREMTVEDLIDKIESERHTGYPVVHDDRLVGCVTLEDVQKIDPERRSNYTVKDIMSRAVKTVTPDQDIYEALKLISREDIGRVMVVEDDQLVGILTRSDILKGFQLRQLQNTEV